ncbi:hypothetical protein NP233_g12513 [Leucocoprinus birnbaumii]|uniref:Uncharacterized protein n=1 Tax=Leucocoprinus birnbaumii TaxID=56174 RepID=A0AAD5VIF8_9AGAR|nr:hypothetical protein NP233_g12513 [Leucocoprinus birnbaumii]
MLLSCSTELTAISAKVAKTYHNSADDDYSAYICCYRSITLVTHVDFSPLSIVVPLKAENNHDEHNGQSKQIELRTTDLTYRSKPTTRPEFDRISYTIYPKLNNATFTNPILSSKFAHYSVFGESGQSRIEHTKPTKRRITTCNPNTIVLPRYAGERTSVNRNVLHVSTSWCDHTTLFKSGSAITFEYTGRPTSSATFHKCTSTTDSDAPTELTRITVQHGFTRSTVQYDFTRILPPPGSSFQPTLSPPVVSTTNPQSPPPSSTSNAPVYKYKFHDAGNNQIACESDPTLPTFTVSTTRGFMDMPKRSVVTCAISNEKGRSVVGEFDWKAKKIIVGGVSKSIDEAKKKVGGTFSLDSEWTWPSGVYGITHKSRMWTARHNGHDVAVYKSLEVKAFSKNELATLSFLVDMPYEERVFLILALMYHDFQLPPVAEPKSFGERAGEAGVSVATTVATNVATNAISSCCVVQ